MSQAKVQGGASGTGSVTLLAPNTNSTQVLTLPDATDTVAALAATQTFTNKTYTNPTFSGTASGTVIVSGTAVASTSGTSITFSSIPSWVKRITVMFNGVSTSGTSLVQLQVGSGSVTTTGYNSAAAYGVSAGQLVTATTGFAIDVSGGATAAALRYGTYVITLIGSNTWSGVGSTYSTAAGTNTAGSGCSPSLSGALDRVVVTTVNGTDTFDAGSINILYE